MKDKHCAMCGNFNDLASIIPGETWYCDFCDHENVTGESELELEQDASGE